MNLSRQDFPFPYTPYPSQVEFMKCLYSALDTGRLAIMESPTGTGKSMSLICGSLAWLKDFEAAEMNRLKEKSSVVINDVGDDWFSAQAQQIEVKHEANVAKKSILEIEQHLKKISLYPTQLKKHRELSEYGNSNSRKIPVKTATSDKDTQTVDLDLILVNDGTELKEEDEDELEEKARLPKIIYCSRTHSQLAQFVSEIKKSPYSKDVRVVTLGSRQNYCVNESVKNFKSSHLINEKCLELRQNKPKSSGPSAAKKQKRDHCKYGCNSNGLEILRMSAMTAVHDVEDLFKLGQKEEACPYYGAKACVDDAQVVVAPYNILLLKESREVYGIKLEGNIVIIDEAHNLLETESSIHSAEVSLMQLKCAHSQLAQYLDRFIGKLNPANLLKIRQLLHVHVKLLAALEKKTGDVESVYLMDEFLNETELMDYNLVELVEFAGKSRLAQKLNGFTARYNPTLEIQIQKQSSTPAKTGVQGFLSKLSQNKVPVKVPEAPVTQPTILEAGVGVNPILPVLTFIKMLVCHSESGRIVCHSGQQQNSIKFLLLNPGSMFHDVVSKSRAVILAGGTMKPTWDVRHELFNDSERIEEHSFQHVVPPENVLPLVLTKASTGSCTFDFSYESRGNRNMIKALGETLINISSVIPNGMVVFFPSHKYLQLVCKVWKEEGLDKNLERHKKLFREPDSMNKVDAVLKDYAVHCNPTKDAAKGYGAMLLSVVGGRLSEGINFSNELCRCVAVVGLPYPNIKSPELIAKMQYQKSKFKSVSGGKDPASEYYNNLCMKAVNQCIGRAIRHQNDYAAMLLLDQRYQAQHVRSALPSWIENNLTICKDFNVGRSSLQKFFGRHKV